MSDAKPLSTNEEKSLRVALRTPLRSSRTDAAARITWMRRLDFPGNTRRNRAKNLERGSDGGHTRACEILHPPEEAPVETLSHFAPPLPYPRIERPAFITPDSTLTLVPDAVTSTPLTLRR